MKKPEAKTAATVPSPPTKRVVEILEFLHAAPESAYTFADIARNVRISKGTCHAVLATLVEEGYLTRDTATKRYGLGPALIHLGRVAEERFSPIALVRSSVGALQKDLGLPCSVVARRGDHLVVVEQLPASQGDDEMSRVGQRVPLRPPFGEIFIAWSDEHARHAWLSAAAEADRERLQTVLREVRERGYTVQRLSEAGVRLGLALVQIEEQVPSQTRSLAQELIAQLNQRDILETELAPGGSAFVTVMSAPVFDAAGKVDLGVSVWPRRELSVNGINRLGRRLLKMTSATSHLLGWSPT